MVIHLHSLRRNIGFVRKCLTLMAENRLGFSVFILLSVLASITEGVSVALLVPVLESQGGSGSFAGIPIFKHMSNLFSDMPSNEKLKLAAFALLVIILLRGLLQYAVTVVSTNLPLTMQHRLAVEAYTGLMNVRIGFVNQSSAGQLSTNFLTLPTQLSIVVIDVATIIWNSGLLLAYVVLMLAISWQITLISIVFLAVISMLLRRFAAPLLNRAGRESIIAAARLSQIGHESLLGTKQIRLSVAERYMTGKFSQGLRNAISIQSKINLLSALPNPVLTTCSGVLICSLLYIASAIGQQETGQALSQILLFLFLLSRLLSPVTTINTVRNRITQNRHAFDTMQGFLAETRIQRQPSGNQQIGSLTGDIIFDHVTFRYEGKEITALDDVSFTIPHGKMVALVGRSGAGKSTVTALVARLYDPASGRIMVGDTDLRDLDILDWRKRIGVVSQDIVLFNDTLANNITFGLQDISAEDMRAACRLASLDTVIDALPDGYETMVGDRGVRLSGGQQQRVAIARAILANPNLLIFDEATSHLDAVTEASIQTAMSHLRQRHTMLVVAHRLSTIQKADQIVVFEQGRIVETGSHAELMDRDGPYRTMIEHQTLDVIDDVKPAQAEQVQ